jgi:hypothetical protein
MAGYNEDRQQARITGSLGTVFINDTSVTSGPFWKIEGVTSFDVDAVSASGISNSSDISSGTTYAAGAVIVGKMETVQLISGTVIGYKW